MYFSAKINKPGYVSEIIDRPHLYSQLDCWEEHRGIIIHAPAGYGKSTLVSRWIDVSGLSGHAAWFSLEKEDSDPRQFIHTFAAALDHCLPGLLAAMQPVLEDRRGSQQKALGRLFTILEDDTLLGGRAADHHLLLVLDDLQRVASLEVDALIHTILEYGPENLHLIMLSRRRTELALSRLYSRGLILVLAKNDLRFRETEIQAYLLAHGFPTPSARNLAELTRRSEGWVSGLRLAVLSLGDSSSISELLRALKGDREWLAALLTDEVLNRREPALRLFLMQTSILDKFNAELCAAVTRRRDAHALLAAATLADLFLIRLDDQEGGWFRYHHLFQDVLQQCLVTELGVGAVTALHRRAAAWLSAAGQIHTAVHHLLAAGAEKEAVELVESRVHQTLIHDPFETKRLFDLLPPRLWQGRPRLLIDYCTLAMLLDDRRAIDYVKLAADEIESQGLSLKNDPAMCGEWLVVRASACLMANDLKGASSYAGQALAYIMDLDDFYSGFLLFVQLHQNYKKGGHVKLQQIADRALAAFSRAEFLIGTVALKRQLARWAMGRGDSQEATRRFRALLDDLPHNRPDIIGELGWAYVIAAENSYWQNDLKQAHTYSQAALPLAQQLHDDGLIYCCNILGTSSQPDGSMAISPNRSLHTEPDWAASRSSFNLAIDLDIRRLTAAGLAEDAWFLAQKTGVDPVDVPAVYKHISLIPYLRAAIALGQELEAMTPLLAGALTYHTKIGNRFKQLQLMVLSAWQQLKLHETHIAAVTLAEAAQLAQETGYVRVILEIPELAELLQKVDHSLELASLPTENRSHTIDLTERERQILKLLASNYTYQQIGDALSISINTVRTHVRHLYKKLSVNRRVQAIAVAKREGLIDNYEPGVS